MTCCVFHFHFGKRLLSIVFQQIPSDDMFLLFHSQNAAKLSLFSCIVITIDDSNSKMNNATSKIYETPVVQLGRMRRTLNATR